MQHTEYSLKLEYFCTTLFIPCRCSHDTSQRSSILIVLIGVARQVSDVKLFGLKQVLREKMRWMLESCADGVFGVGLVEYNDGCWCCVILVLMLGRFNCQYGPGEEEYLLRS